MTCSYLVLFVCYLITDNVWLIYIFLSLFIFFYHWSSRSRIPAGQMGGWGRNYELESSPVQGSFFCFLWLLARATFYCLPAKNKTATRYTIHWSFHLLPPFFLQYKAAWRTQSQVPIEIIWHGTVCPRTTASGFSHRATRFLLNSCSFPSRTLLAVDKISKRHDRRKVYDLRLGLRPSWCNPS